MAPAFAAGVTSIDCAPNAYAGLTEVIITNTVPICQYQVVGITPAGACYVELLPAGDVTIYCKGVTSAGAACPCDN
jgi:hypothetical protein